MTPDRIKQLRELCEGATKGPWEVAKTKSIIKTDKEISIASALMPKISTNSIIGNAKFIAEARTAMPELLDEVERLKEQLKHYQQIEKESKKRFNMWPCHGCDESCGNSQCYRAENFCEDNVRVVMDLKRQLRDSARDSFREVKSAIRKDGE